MTGDNGTNCNESGLSCSLPSISYTKVGSIASSRRKCMRCGEKREKWVYMGKRKYPVCNQCASDVYVQLDLDDKYGPNRRWLGDKHSFEEKVK